MRGEMKSSSALLCVLTVLLMVVFAMYLGQLFENGTFHAQVYTNYKQTWQSNFLNEEFPMSTVPMLSKTIISPPKSAKFSICMRWLGRLGNQMFQFASSYGIATSKGMSLILSKDGLRLDVFKINYAVKNDKFIKKHCKILKEKYELRYNEDIVNISSNDSYDLVAGLQSWKYFHTVSNALRKQFIFIDSIQEQRNVIISSVLSKYNISSRSKVTLIGFHMRRGDFLLQNKSHMSVASRGYLNRAVHFFLTKVQQKAIFIVCSNDMDWIKQNIPSGISAEFIEGNSPGVDMAVLGSCDHMLSTTGTFSWWSGWLCGGIVTYYQWPDKEGTPDTKLFNVKYSDFFYPGWIGIP